MSRPYRPRRVSKKWLEGAPEYVLDVHDDPQYTDRYSVWFGPPVWHPDMGKRIPVLVMSKDPTYPLGVSMWDEVPAYTRPSTRTRIRWLDLPENVREHTINRATE